MDSRVRNQVDRSIDLRLLKPVLRAYALGYTSSVVPRLFGLLRSFRRTDKTIEEKLDLLYHVLRTSTQPNRFPTSCAIIVAGATLLPRLLRAILVLLIKSIGGNTSFLLTSKATTRLRFITTFLSAWTAFNLLNRDQGWTRKRAISRSSPFFSTFQDSPNQHHRPPVPPAFAGKTMDFTLFAATRALDVLVLSLWTHAQSHPHHPSHTHPHLASLLRSVADPSIFAASAAVIMWSWFYSPSRLPRAYNHWISSIASIDPSLITALRRAREGTFIYGQSTDQTPLLTPLCTKLNLPAEWADPSTTIPIPCELVHSGTGRSCLYHALSRFAGAFRFALEMYLPLNLLLHLRHPTPTNLLKSILSSARSSAFLGTFVSLFYLSVCCARTLVGPLLFPPPVISPQTWDSGLCVLAGCLACGWSILIEKRGRRQEIAFFVVPRALATLLPRVYERRCMWREQVVFAASVAVVMGRGRRRSEEGVRGVLGKVLGRVLRE